MTDALSRAYATLGLPFGASRDQVKRRYRLLVKRWHPDRFTADAVGQAEASQRLAHINTAYRVLVERPAEPVAPAPSPTRLTRDQIDGMVRAIGTESPLDWLLGWCERVAYPSTDLEFGNVQPTTLALAIILGLVFIALHIRYGCWPTDAVAVGVAAVARVALWISRRRA